MVSDSLHHAVVFGAGALGSWLGARLAVPTVLVARGEHARAMREHGLRLGGIEDALLDVVVADTCPALKPATLVLVTVKAVDLDAAAAAIGPRLRRDSLVAVVANGLEPEALLGEALGRPVVRVVSEFGATLDAPGKVSAWGGTAVLNRDPAATRVAQALKSTGLKIRRVADLRPVAWEKLILNCVANPLAALTGRRNRDLITPELAELRRAVIAEGMAVAAAEGVTVRADLAEHVDALLGRSRNLNSMAQDMLRGRPTEIDHLNGEVARIGERLGVATPVNRWLADMVRLKEGAARASQ